MKNAWMFIVLAANLFIWTQGKSLVYRTKDVCSGSAEFEAVSMLGYESDSFELQCPICKTCGKKLKVCNRGYSYKVNKPPISSKGVGETVSDLEVHLLDDLVRAPELYLNDDDSPVQAARIPDSQPFNFTFYFVWFSHDGKQKNLISRSISRFFAKPRVHYVKDTMMIQQLRKSDEGFYHCYYNKRMKLKVELTVLSPGEEPTRLLMSGQAFMPKKTLLGANLLVETVQPKWLKSECTPCGSKHGTKLEMGICMVRRHAQNRPILPQRLEIEAQKLFEEFKDGLTCRSNSAIRIARAMKILTLVQRPSELRQKRCYKPCERGLNKAAELEQYYDQFSYPKGRRRTFMLDKEVKLSCAVRGFGNKPITWYRMPMTEDEYDLVMRNVSYDSWRRRHNLTISLLAEKHFDKLNLFELYFKTRGAIRTDSSESLIAVSGRTLMSNKYLVSPGGFLNLACVTGDPYSLKHNASDVPEVYFITFTDETTKLQKTIKAIRFIVIAFPCVNGSVILLAFIQLIILELSTKSRRQRSGISHKNKI